MAVTNVSKPAPFALPLVSPAAEEAQAAPAWQGFTPAAAVTELQHSDATAAPEPALPQGAYGIEAAPLSVPLTAGATAAHRVELLAPAGGAEAGFAAFHYGADAIYLGLKKFSARAEAENFTLEELDEITAYAHSLTPRRRVFVTVNTLIRQDEIAELVEDLAALEAIGVDALIIQDLGVYHLVRRYFPKLELHASTQLAVHNRAGAEALKQLGFTRVVLARELTFEEVRDITGTSGIETEVFIHGALCYSYSGLCLFSSQTLGRSGNRGKCAYSCRDLFQVSGAPATLRDGSAVKRDPAEGFPFSMKDLALPDHIPALRAAGVSCFKVEGRKKSPLYVATTVDYYRKLMDGRLSPRDRPEHEADMQTVFSRPWTRLFVQSHKDKEVADRDTVGHRGTVIGEVMELRPGREPRLRFQTSRPLERHDGLQIDLPVFGKPFGFPVDRLWHLQGSKRREVFEAPAGAMVEVELPQDHPEIPRGAPVYCSSSQAVKRTYQHGRPKAGLFQGRMSIAVDIELTSAALHVVARTLGSPAAEVCQIVPGPFPAAKDALGMEQAAREAFAKLGATHLALQSFLFRNEEGCFVPVSRLNQLRRDLSAALEQKLAEQRRERIAQIQMEVCPSKMAVPGCLRATARHPFRWSLKVDRLEFLEALEPEDWGDVDELIIDIARDHVTTLLERVEHWGKQIGRERIRLALPPLTRKWEEAGLQHKIAGLRAAGWTKWEAANLSAWTYLRQEGESAFPIHPSSLILHPLDLATDWSVYTLNRMAVQQLFAMGVGRVTLSPEDGLANLGSLLAEFGPKAVVIVHQDTPLFLAESCAYANLIGGCPGKANCKFESMDMVSSHGEKVTALDYHCRTIVLNQGPFCLSTRLADLAAAGAAALRVDFLYRRYDPLEVRRVWQLVRAGKPVPGGHAANFDRGVL